MKNDICWLNISLPQNDLKEVRTFVKEFKATLPAGTSFSRSNAVRIAITEGINSIRKKWNVNVRENQKPVTDKTIQAEDC